GGGWRVEWARPQFDEPGDGAQAAESDRALPQSNLEAGAGANDHDDRDEPRECESRPANRERDRKQDEVVCPDDRRKNEGSRDRERQRASEERDSQNGETHARLDDDRDVGGAGAGHGEEADQVVALRAEHAPQVVEQPDVVTDALIREHQKQPPGDAERGPCRGRAIALDRDEPDEKGPEEQVEGDRCADREAGYPPPVTVTPGERDEKPEHDREVPCLGRSVGRRPKPDDAVDAPVTYVEHPERCGEEQEEDHGVDAGCPRRGEQSQRRDEEGRRNRKDLVLAAREVGLWRWEGIVSVDD